MIVVPVLVKQRAVNLIYVHSRPGPHRRRWSPSSPTSRARADVVHAADPAGARRVVTDP